MFTRQHSKLTFLIFGFSVIGFLFFTTFAFGQTKPAVAKPPIKIGYLAALSGVFAGQGTDMKDGFILRINEKGGKFAGRQVEVLVEDCEGKPDVALTKAKRLVERYNVRMLVGVYTSGEAYAVAEYANSQKIPLFIHNAGANDLTQSRFSPYIFRGSFSNSQLHHPLGDWAYKKGYRKAVLVAQDYSGGYEQSGGFAQTFTEMGGQIVQELYIPMGTPDPGPFITAIKRENVDLVYAFSAGADGLRFVRRYDEYGMKKRAPLIGTIGLTDESILPEEGDAALGIVVTGAYTGVLDTPANKAFLDLVRKTYKRPATTYLQAGYTGSMVLEKALESVKGNIEDKESFMKALEKVEIPDSPRGPFTFDKYHNIVCNVYICEVKKIDGNLVNALVETYKNVSQFWKYSPEEYLKMPSFTSMKGKWAKQ